MLTKDDLTGLCVYVPTPCIDGGDHWSVTESVDLDKSAAMVEELIQAGAAMIGTCGTTGENSALLWDEKVAFNQVVIETVRGRIPIFAGATALGTKEVIRQMRAYKDMGADGAFVGLPLWQTPTLEVQIQWYQDLGEAVPDMPIMVYGNPNFFKSNFPTPLWQGVAERAPTVIACKGGIDTIEDNVKVAGHQVRFIPNDSGALDAYKRAPEHIKCLWSTSAAMGADPLVALVDALVNDDVARAEQVDADLRSVPAWIPSFAEFPFYNTQAAKARFLSSDHPYGPSRAPYHDPLPEEWAKACDAHGKAWAELRSKYAKAPV